jgi:hypothetical protein
MKILVLMLSGTLLYACTTEKEVQVDVIDVKLIKIETVQRYPNVRKKLLTWRDTNNIDYVTYEPVTVNYPLGTYMKVMVRR